MSGANEGLAKAGMVAREILETEQKYVSDLERILSYQRSMAEHLLGPEERLVLFANLDELLVFHKGLLGNMAGGLGDAAALSGNETRLLQSLLNAFVDANFTDVYATYCANYPRAERLLTARSRDTVVADALQDIKGKGQLLNLQDYLLTPVQRVTRYPMLMAQLMKKLPEDSPWLPQADTVRIKMTETAESVNQLKRKRELHSIAFGEVFVSRSPSLRQRLVGLEVDWFELGELVEEDDNFMLNSRWHKPSQRRLFLFENALLSCKARPDGAISLKTLYWLRDLQGVKELKDGFVLELQGPKGAEQHSYRHAAFRPDSWFGYLRVFDESTSPSFKRAKALRRNSTGKLKVRLRSPPPAAMPALAEGDAAAGACLTPAEAKKQFLRRSSPAGADDEQDQGEATPGAGTDVPSAATPAEDDCVGPNENAVWSRVQSPANSPDAECRDSPPLRKAMRHSIRENLGMVPGRSSHRASVFSDLACHLDAYQLALSQQLNTSGKDVDKDKRILQLQRELQKARLDAEHLRTKLDEAEEEALTPSPDFLPTFEALRPKAENTSSRATATAGKTLAPVPGDAVNSGDSAPSTPSTKAPAYWLPAAAFAVGAVLCYGQGLSLDRVLVGLVGSAVGFLVGQALAQ